LEYSLLIRMSAIHSQRQVTLLLIEDDERLAELVRSYLERHGLTVLIETHGDHAVARARSEQPEIVILDIGLPGQDGFAICKALRPEFTAPILILTARDSDFDQVVGLELGADDYVVKPVEPRVLLARIQALLRRAQSAIAPAPDQRLLKFGSLSINLATRNISLNQQAIMLTTHEFELLSTLALRAGEIQTREALYQQLYKREYDGLDRTLDVRVSHLRKKLGDDNGNPTRIKTVWGQGYLFAADAW
jgi:DNA-binding response OmpR family regulator